MLSERALPEYLSQYDKWSEVWGEIPTVIEGLFKTDRDPWRIREHAYEGQTDRGDIEFYNANLQAMKADRNAMVQLNQRTFPTIQESVEVPNQGISPTGKEGLPRDSSPPGEKICYPPWRGAGSVPVIASVPTRQLDPRPRTQTRPTDQMIPVRAAVNRAGTGAGNGPCFNGTRFREPRATAADGGNPTVGYCGHANADPRTTNAGTV